MLCTLSVDSSIISKIPKVSKYDKETLKIYQRLLQVSFNIFWKCLEISKTTENFRERILIIILPECASECIASLPKLREASASVSNISTIV